MNLQTFSMSAVALPEGYRLVDYNAGASIN